MATYLYRLGGWAFARRRRVVGAWVFVLGVVIACAMAFGGQTSNKFEVPGTESQQAITTPSTKTQAPTTRRRRANAQPPSR